MYPQYKLNIPLVIVGVLSVGVLVGCNPEKSTEKLNATTRAHYKNPFEKTSNWYVNEHWAKRATESGGAVIAGESTAIWLDKISEVTSYDGATPKDGFGLREHLDAALEQGADLVTLVIYNLPGKNCSQRGFFGDLEASAEGMKAYKEQYIDRIVNVLGSDKYAGISIATIVEPYALEHLTYNHRLVDCEAVANDKPWGYTEGIRYALTQFATLPNVHAYLSVAGSAIGGWESELEVQSMFMAGVLKGYEGLDGQALGDEIESKEGSVGRYIDLGGVVIESVGETPPPGWGAINGFATNINDYVPLDEPYFDQADLPSDGEYPLYTATFYDWNPTFGELDYTQEWSDAMKAYGAGDIGILIDTSRNGWGKGRALAEKNIANGGDVSTAEEAVSNLRIDIREHRRSWCNQKDAGIGERPQASPEGHVHAYLWVKSIGESDGISTADFEVDPNRSSKKSGSDRMCDPDNLSHFAEAVDLTANLDLGTGAMPDAPRKGRWFEEGFKQLMENAYPKL